MNARSVAADVVRRVGRGAHLSPALDEALGTSSLERIDRAFVTDLVYGTVRYALWVDGLLDARLRDRLALPPEVVDALRIGTYEIVVRGTPRHAAVDAWVEIVKHVHPRLSGLVNAVLRRVDGDPTTADPSQFVPPVIWKRFRSALGDAAPAAVRSMLEPSPLWFTTFRRDAEELLERQGCTVRSGPIAETVRAKCPVPVRALEAYRRGAVQPQNPVSAWVAAIVPVHDGDRVLDVCSGHGIKAAHLAARGASVEGWDVSSDALAGAARNLRRLGLDVRHVVRDATQDASHVATARHVVVDAPCSGTGTLRSHPEIARRLTDEAIETSSARQRAILDAVAPLVEPGGTLTYAVCALTPEEGPGVALDVTTRHPGLAVRALDVPFDHVETPVGAFVLPSEGLDGFFVAQWTRTSAP